MSRSESVKVGTAYVNERDDSIREVVEELDRFRIRFNEYKLQTGRLIAPPLRTAYKRPFIRWASREATPRELALLHPNGKHAWHRPPRPQELRNLEHEHRRAGLEQVVQSSVMHRW